FDSDVGYGNVLWGLARYLFYPFGKYIKLMSDEAYLEEDQGEGRSISEYEQWQSGDIEEGRLFFGPVRNLGLVGRRRNSVDSDDETQSLLGRSGRQHERLNSTSKPKRRLFGRGKWTLARVAFFVVFYGLLTPFLFLVSGICWLFVFSIPMGRVTLLLIDHLRRHPLALEFHSDKTDIRQPGAPPSSIIVCTYRAVGLKYWKYTIDGTNIFLINLLAIVAFTIFDYYVLAKVLHIDIFLTSNGLVFALALFSIIPLAYFIGQAVASISAQSSMGVGATVNAFFSTVVEVFLYCVALNEGKAQLVEGSIIGSIFAGVLFLPGLSMCFGAIKRKTQRFNVKSAGVTSTMLLFAVIAAFSPTLFYQIYGSVSIPICISRNAVLIKFKHELNCHSCISDVYGQDRDCRRCYFDQAPAVYDRFYISAVRPYIWFCAVLLFLSYAIGLFFTLRTHAAVIWNTEIDEKKADRPPESASHSHHYEGRGPIPTPFPTLSRQQTRTDVRDTQLYRRILGQSLKQIGASDGTGPSSPEMRRKGTSSGFETPEATATTPHAPPSRSREHSATSGIASPTERGIFLTGLSEEDNRLLQRQVAEMAATAATVAARDATKNPRMASHLGSAPATASGEHRQPVASRRASKADVDRQLTSDELASVTGAAQSAGAMAEAAAPAQGGHDAPNWGRTKSAVILLTATVAYAVIAEILVNTVDAVLENVDIDEKFLGITLFALVPNTTEFLNAISFAMNGNIALSMEIGSAYALQVCLLQVPCLVLFSGVHGRFIDEKDIIDHTFSTSSFLPCYLRRN
ncbi:MAG: hypothetical protein INR71_03070, partial [Terriglobus roseus]|nr:hypothetical protein [Terriglobus roseus]